VIDDRRGPLIYIDITEGDKSMLSSCLSNLKTRAAGLALAAGLVMLCSLPTEAQAPGSSRGLPGGEGNHTIQGRVHFPSGQSKGSNRVKVSLEGGSSSTQSTLTDEDGAFRFNQILPGSYTVVVDAGKEFETAHESVNIDRENSVGSMISNVEIMLKLKADANPAFADVPKAALDLYQKGAAAAQKGNIKGAAEFFSQAVSAYPNFAAALGELGIQYVKLGQMDKAGEAFEALVKLKPADPVARLNLGIALYNQNKLDAAEPHLREAIKLNNAGPSAHYYLGLTLIKTKRYDEAQKELETTIANGGDNISQAHKFLGGLYMNAKKNKQAADELEKYLQLDPKAPNAEQIRGTIKGLRSNP
jgi:tetratricopeptide (TPR) repeat protein